MAMPSPDFSLCLFLIPERVQMEEQFKTLIVLSHYLETGRFSQFWDEASKNRHIVEAVPEIKKKREGTCAFNKLFSNFATS
ncbi:eukaryotic translation initiation factor 3 subunit K-like [Malus domestica]|uniref:eukaryotic translation initiation factor 3 subunit K-like n=1 Tax=Malus domestica TaxID=3750 RepID=UPI0010AA232E|nr:eukaryotic translation initiation factor 3 subunit K-like [Malus domestica]